MVVWSQATANANPIAVSATAAGVNWNTNLGSSAITGYNSSSNLAHGIAILPIFSASALATTITSTVTVKPGGGSGSTTPCKVEFALLEFSGVIATNANSYFNTRHTLGTNAPVSMVFPASTFSAFTGLVIEAFSGEGATQSAGVSFTLGPAATAVTVGQSQYAPTQAYNGTPAFIGTSAFWAGFAYWMADGTVGASSFSFAPQPLLFGF
jgi:hypothetical protein